MQYSDKNKFRFTVQLQNSRTISGSGTQRGSANDLTKFVMTDRVTEKKYETRNYTAIRLVNALDINSCSVLDIPI